MSVRKTTIILDMKITIVVDNIPLIYLISQASSFIFELIVPLCVLLFLLLLKLVLPIFMFNVTFCNGIVYMCAVFLI